MQKSTKKSKTKELEQTAVLEETLPVVPNDPVVEADTMKLSLERYCADMCKPVSRAFARAISAKFGPTQIARVSVNVTQFDRKDTE